MKSMCLFWRGCQNGGDSSVSRSGFQKNESEVTGGKDSENCLREFWRERERGNQHVIGG